MAWSGNVPRNAVTCPECDEPLGRVSKPGTGRLLANVLPGTTAVTSLILLANADRADFLRVVPAPIVGPTGPMA